MSRVDDESVSKLTAEDIVDVDKIKTGLPVSKIVYHYHDYKITRREFVGLMLYMKMSLFDINLYLMRESPHPKYTLDPDRVLSIIPRLQSINRRLTLNILRQQTGWLKDDCKTLLDSMVADGSIKLVQETIQGKVVNYYVLPT